MAGMLRRAGYRDPVPVAARLQSEGIGPAELDWRLRTGQSLQKTSRNPFGLSGTDILLAIGGIAAVGLVGYLIWNQQQAAQEQSTAAANGYPGLPLQPASASLNQPSLASSSQVLLGAQNFLPPPGSPALPQPPYAPGGSPLPVAPSA
jgi:hypothetical protein